MIILGGGNLRLTPSLCRQSVYSVITLALRPHLSAEGKRSGSAQSTAIGIDVNDTDLNRSMILGCN
jgi:hypothetical protein